jgi:TolB-like protein/DNA-binding winged helix-turn-helix (wHTH) protein
MDIREAKSFDVGGWRVTPDEDVVSRDGRSERLEPLAMQVLVYLASRAGEVVSRSDLEEAVWKGGVVSYDSVTSTVIKLRKALGDDARKPSYITTIPKRGYQLIAPVSLVVDEPSAQAASAESVAPVPSARADRRKVATLVAVLITAAAAILGVLTQLTPPAVESDGQPVSSPPSIVVLPFQNLSDDPSQERFADGITEDIITDLSGITGVRVIASNTSFSYKGRQVSAQEIGDELHIDYVLEGSVRRRDDSIRVNAQLVDVRTAFQVWAHRYDRAAQETFAVQDELTNQIVETLAVQLSPQESERLARQPTNNLAAYDHFQEGQRLGKINTKDSNIEAQHAYRKAIETDPTYGRAYGALAYTLAYNFRRGWNDAPMQTIDRALELAQRGVELDASIPQTFWSLGYVHLMRKEFALAEQAVETSLSIAPNYADGFGLLALINNSLGNAKAAIANIQKGMQLNPFYTWDYPYNLGRAYYVLGEYDKAIPELESAKTRNPNVMPVRLVLAACYVRTGRAADAEWEIEEVQAINPNETLSHLANTFATNDAELLQRFLHDLREAGLPE